MQLRNRLWLTFSDPDRHAPRCSGNFPRHTSQQASDDVQRHTRKGDSGHVQEVYEQREISLPFLFFLGYSLTRVSP